MSLKLPACSVASKPEGASNHAQPLPPNSLVSTLLDELGMRRSLVRQSVLSTFLSNPSNGALSIHTIHRELTSMAGTLLSIRNTRDVIRRLEASGVVVQLGRETFRFSDHAWEKVAQITLKLSPHDT